MMREDDVLCIMCDGMRMFQYTEKFLFTRSKKSLLHYLQFFCYYLSFFPNGSSSSRRRRRGWWRWWWQCIRRCGNARCGRGNGDFADMRVKVQILDADTTKNAFRQSTFIVTLQEKAHVDDKRLGITKTQSNDARGHGTATTIQQDFERARCLDV
jgi:hypothetical protein